MAGGHRLPKGSKRTGSSGRRGAHRAKPRHPEPYAWLGAGAVTLGLGAALASGTGVAYADDGTTGTSTSEHSAPSTNQSPAGQTTAAEQTATTPKKKAPKKKKPVVDTTTETTTEPDATTPTDPTGETTETPKPETETPPAADPDTPTVTNQHPKKTGTKKSADATAKADAKSDSKPAANDDAAAKSGDTPEAATEKTPEVAATPTATTFSAAALTSTPSTASTLATAAATPAAEPAVPKAIAVPLLKGLAGFLNFFGVNTNSPLPPLDLGLAGAWTWFRQLQTEWGIAPPTAGTPSATEPDPGTGVVTGYINPTNAANLPLTYTVAINPLLGSVTVNKTTGFYSYTPSDAARIGAVLVPVNDIFTVTVSNGIASNYVPVTVKVGAITSAVPGIPTLVSQTTNSSTGLVTGQVGASGPAGSTLTYSVVTPTLGGTLNFNSDGSFTYQPNAVSRALASLGLMPNDAFTVIATNGSIPGLPGIITVPVLGGNAIPSAPSSISQSTNTTTGLVTGQIGSADPGEQTLAYTVITSSLFGTLNFNKNTGAYTYQPSAASMALAKLGLLSTDGFTVVASNGTFISAPTIISLPVTAGNATPTNPVAGTLTTNLVSGLVTGSVSSTDPADQPLTYTVVTSTVGGTLNFDKNTGTFTYQPNDIARASSTLGVTTTDFFTVYASNGTFNSGLVTINVPIAPNPIPSTPTKTSQTQNLLSGYVTGTIGSTDPAGLPITYTVVTSTLGGTLTLDKNTGAFTYQPNAAARIAAGVTPYDAFTVVASNGYGTSSITTINVPIAPTVTPSAPSKTGTETVNSSGNGAVVGQLTASDSLGSPLTYSITTQGVSGSVSVTSSGVYTYTPTSAARNLSWLGFPTTDIFTVTVTNGYYSSFSIITVPISPKSPF